MSDLEPLQSLLSLYKHKGDVLRHYIPKKTAGELTGYEYYEGNGDMLYLNDTVIFVSKGTGAIQGKGKIIRIKKNRVTIQDNRDNLSLTTDDHYVFIRPRKTTNKDKRDMFRAILQKLGD
jgi:hypothetical protein